MADKEFYVTPISKFNCQSFPIIENKKILINDEILQQLGITKCFDLEHMCVVDYDNTEDLKRQIVQERITEIKMWFEEYDNQVKQYQRCVRLGIDFDKDIVELDNQAKAHQEELRMYNDYIESCKLQAKELCNIDKEVKDVTEL